MFQERHKLCLPATEKGGFCEWDFDQLWEVRNPDIDRLTATNKIHAINDEVV